VQIQHQGLGKELIAGLVKQIELLDHYHDIGIGVGVKTGQHYDFGYLVALIESLNLMVTAYAPIKLSPTCGCANSWCWKSVKLNSNVYRSGVFHWTLTSFTVHRKRQFHAHQSVCRVWRAGL
jgi:hypothetical protein